MDQRECTRNLIQLFFKQLTEGCGDSNCPKATCYNHRIATSDKPLRRYTELSARAAAFHLATLENPWMYLCGPIIESINCGKVVEGPNLTSNDDDKIIASDTSPSKIDMKSYSQVLFDTNIVKEFLEAPHLAELKEVSEWHDFQINLDMAQEYLRSAPEWAALGATAILTCVKDLEEIFPANGFGRDPDEMQAQLDLVFEEDAVFEAARQLVSILSQLSVLTSHICPAASCTSNNIESMEIIRKVLECQFKRRDKMFWAAPNMRGAQDWMALRQLNLGIQVPLTEIFVLIQCSTRVFQRLWDGNSNVGFHTVAGQAIRALSMLRHMLLRMWPHSPNDRFFDDTTREGHLGPMEYAKQYVDRKPGHISLLEYPWIFCESDQVKTFRALSFRRMERAVEEANLNVRLLVSGMSWSSIDPPEVRQLVMGPLRTATARCFALQVSREDLLDDLFTQLWRRERRELLRPLRVQILNQGEEGLDQGGVAQELFQAALTAILDPAYGMFKVDETTRMAWFDPASMHELHKYEILGVLLALAIHNGFILPVTFPLAFYRKLISSDDLGSHPRNIRDGWPTLSKSFEELLDWSDGDVADVFVRQYAFSYEVHGEVIHVDMTKPYTDDWTSRKAQEDSDINSLEAPLVTNANRTAFVTDYISWLTDKSIRAQFSAFARGFHSLIPQDLLNTVTPSAFQILTEGHPAIDMQELEAATDYEGGFNPTTPTIQDFWAIVGAYDDAHKRNLLEFVTASDRLPVSGARGVRFMIQKNGGDGERLPTAMTCFATLLLPEYGDREKLRGKLEVVLGEAKGFGLR